jgi:hypothetical protein
MKMKQLQKNHYKANASLQPLQEKQKVEEEEGAALPWVG